MRSERMRRKELVMRKQCMFPLQYIKKLEGLVIHDPQQIPLASYIPAVSLWVVTYFGTFKMSME